MCVCVCVCVCACACVCTLMLRHAVYKCGSDCNINIYSFQTVCYSKPLSAILLLLAVCFQYSWQISCTPWQLLGLAPRSYLYSRLNFTTEDHHGRCHRKQRDNRDWCCHTLYCRYVDPASPWSTALNYSPYNSFGSTGLAGRGLYSCPTQQVCAYHPSYHADAAGSVGGGRETDKFLCPRVVY